ncbi:MAG: hypothetical protein ACFB3T_05655 [Geminicoccaceae bacterium]
MLGNVFSPYYAWSRARDPLDHSALNVALYGDGGKRWAMTERRRSALTRTVDRLRIGPSHVSWQGDELVIEIDECAAPVPYRLRGTVRLSAPHCQPRAFCLDETGGHFWWPIAPNARLEVDFKQPARKWQGVGYLDSNWGAEPLSRAFPSWQWLRTSSPDGGAAIVYDAKRHRREPLQLALEVSASGEARAFKPPATAPLPKTGWRIGRDAPVDPGGEATVLRTLEDTPFYARSELELDLLGQRTRGVHESLSLERFDMPIVRLMLPFRMPRTWR